MRIHVRVVVERSTTNTRHPGLRGGVKYVDDRGAIAPDAREGAGVTFGTEHALSLSRHLLEDLVLGFDVCGRIVILTYGPAGADNISPVIVCDLRVLIQLGLPGEIVRSVVDQDMTCVRCDSELHLDVGV